MATNVRENPTLSEHLFILLALFSYLFSQFCAYIPIYWLNTFDQSRSIIDIIIILYSLSGFTVSKRLEDSVW